MENFDFLSDLFPFVRFCNSPTVKRAEHNIKSLKWGTAKKNSHTCGRWYARSLAYRSIRNKVAGDYTEPEHDLYAVIADDLTDIEEHNLELHPDQKTIDTLLENHSNAARRPRRSTAHNPGDNPRIRAAQKLRTRRVQLRRPRIMGNGTDVKKKR